MGVFSTDDLVLVDIRWSSGKVKICVEVHGYVLGKDRNVGYCNEFFR